MGDRELPHRGLDPALLRRAHAAEDGRGGVDRHPLVREGPTDLVEGPPVAVEREGVGGSRERRPRQERLAPGRYPRQREAGRRVLRAREGDAAERARGEERRDARRDDDRNTEDGEVGRLRLEAGEERCVPREHARDALSGERPIGREARALHGARGVGEEDDGRLRVGGEDLRRRVAIREHHVGCAEQIDRAEGEEAGIAGAEPDERDRRDRYCGAHVDTPAPTITLGQEPTSVTLPSVGRNRVTTELPPGAVKR